MIEMVPRMGRKIVFFFQRFWFQIEEALKMELKKIRSLIKISHPLKRF